MAKERITEQSFRKLKRELKWYVKPAVVARRNHISVKTAVQIKCSKSFEEYTEQNKAQHPATLFSLGEQVLELHRLTFRRDNTYIAPPTARKAIAELQANI